jgi:hypothetical protein
LNQEKNFKFEEIINALPSPNDPEISEASHKHSCSYYKPRVAPKPVVRKKS